MLHCHINFSDVHVHALLVPCCHYNPTWTTATKQASLTTTKNLFFFLILAINYQIISNSFWHSQTFLKTFSIKCLMAKNGTESDLKKTSKVAVVWGILLAQGATSDERHIPTTYHNALQRLSYQSQSGREKLQRQSQNDDEIQNLMKRLLQLPLLQQHPHWWN